MSDALKPLVLIVDDEPQIRRLLRVTLEANGYRVFDAATGADGIAQAAQRRPDAVLLDLGLPDLEGMEVLKRLRESSRVPVIILSVRDREDDKVAALDAGADDYVTKPFNSAELLARLRAVLRHAQPQGADAIFRTGELEVDLSARVVRKHSQEIKLTPIEYSLLRLFVTHAGKVLTHHQLLTSRGKTPHYLRVYTRIVAARTAASRGRDFPHRLLLEVDLSTARRPQARPGNQAHAD